MNFTTKTAIPVFLCTTSTRSAHKEQRLNRLPSLLFDFVINCCKDSGISTVPGEAPDADGEHIIGVAIVRFHSEWGPMLSMDDAKRSMWTPQTNIRCLSLPGFHYYDFNICANPFVRTFRILLFFRLVAPCVGAFIH